MRRVEWSVLVMLLVMASVVYAQTSQVFPSARWAWYLVSSGPENGWSEGGMTRDDITRWIAAHSDLLVAGTVTSVHLQANPNLVGTTYDEWFYVNVVHGFNSANPRPAYLEKFCLQNNLDVELPYFNLTQDYLWEMTAKLYDDQILSGRNTSQWFLMDRVANLYTATGGSFVEMNLPTNVGGWIALGRTEPFHELYLEWQTAPQGGRYVLEYVSATAPNSSGEEWPTEWSPVTILSDGTNGFTQDGLIRFLPPDRWTQWKRAIIWEISQWKRFHFYVRIRCVQSPSNQPRLRTAWLNPVYRPYPYIKSSGEAIYLGFKEPVTSAAIQLLANGVGGSYAFEYASGVGSDGKVNAWTALPNLSDGTNGLTRSGTISWSMPSSPEWVIGQANIGKAPRRYWIRIRLTSAPSTPAKVEKVTAGGRDLYTQEIYASRYLLRVPGWDAQNDRNGDGWVDDSEFANLANPNATARARWQSRVIRSGWEGALNYVLNFANPAIRQAIRDHWYMGSLGDPSKTWLIGIYSDSMVTSWPTDIPKNVPMEEPQSERDNWEANWLEMHRSVRNENPLKIVGGNLTCVEPYAPGENQQRLLTTGYYTHLYNDYINYEGYPYGWITTTDVSFVRRLLNISRANAHGVLQVLQFNMMWNNRARIGGSDDATGWRRFQEHSLAFYYLVQRPGYTYMSIWNGYYYGCNVIDTPLGRMPNVMAYQPTAMLEVDIGQPANSIPQGYSPVSLMYRQGGTFPDNIVVGDTATSVLNNNFAPMAGKPVYPTYVFRLAQGTLPNRPSTTYSVFARKYTKGLVLLKMTSAYTADDTGAASVTTHQLPGTYRRVNWDGTLGPPITEVTLKGMEGAILVDAAQSSVPDIQLTMSVDKPNPKPLDVVTVTVTATNTGSGATSNVGVRIPISGMTYEQGSLSPQEFTVDVSDPSVLKITIPTLGAGQSVTFRFRVVVRQEVR